MRMVQVNCDLDHPLLDTPHPVWEIVITIEDDPSCYRPRGSTFTIASIEDPISKVTVKHLSIVEANID